MMQHDFGSGSVGAASVGATTTVILAANVARKYCVVVNNSDATIYVNLGAAAENNKGIRLNANGGTLEISGDHPFRGAINGITGGGSSKSVVYFEG